MGKDTKGHKQEDSEADNWRMQHRNSGTSSPKKSSKSKGTSRVESTSSLSSSSSSSSSSSKGRREAGNGSSTSLSRVSSTISVSKSASNESHEGQHCRSSHSRGHVSSGNSNNRKNKRMRTKPNVSSRREHEDSSLMTSSSETPRLSSASKATSSRRKSEDVQSKRRNEVKGNRADEDSFWRRRSPVKGAISTQESHGHHRSRDRGESRHGRGKTDTRNKVERKSDDILPKMHSFERKSNTKDHSEDGEGSVENFDFASGIFKDGLVHSKQGIKSNPTTKNDVKMDARSLQLLKISDERRKKEYLGYQPTYVHKLYSYGIDNKGKKEPQKTGLSKKEEDTMFRKRAVYMMHLEEERKRKEHEEKQTEQRDTTKPKQVEGNDVSVILKEVVKQKHSLDSHKQVTKTVPRRRETMVKETNQLLQNMEASLANTLEMATIPRNINDGQCSSDHDRTDKTKQHFAEALNLRTNPSIPDDSKPSTSFMTEPERMEMNTDQRSNEHDSEEAAHKEGRDVAITVSKELNLSSPCDDTEEEFEFEDFTSDHDNELKEENEARMSSCNGYSVGPTSTSDETTDKKTVDAKRDGGNIGRHDGLPTVISELHHRDNKKVMAVSRKDNIIRISPETVCLHELSSSSDKTPNRMNETSQDSSSTREETSDKDGSTMTSVQEDCSRAAVDTNSISSKTQKEEEKETQIHEQVLSTGNILSKSHDNDGQISAPAASVKNNIDCSGPCKSITQSQQYTRIAPSKTGIGIPTYVLPPTSTYIRAPLQQGSIATLPSQIGPKENGLSFRGNHNQSMFPANGNIYLHKMANILDVNPPTIQLSYGNRPFPSQVSNVTCMPVSPLVVLPNNTIPGIRPNQPPYGSPVAGVSGSNALATRSVRQAGDQNLYLDQKCAIINKHVSALKPSANVQFQDTESRQDNISQVPSKSQGLLGYINVPVIKDDKGRLVVVLPNDKTIMGSTQIQKSDVGKVILEEAEAVPKESLGHRDVSSSKQPLLSEIKPDASNDQHGHGFKTEHCDLATIEVENGNSFTAHSSTGCTKDVSPQVDECRSGKPELNVKYTPANKDINNVQLVMTNANNAPNVNQKTNDDVGKDTQPTQMKPLENPNVNKSGESFQSKSVDQLRIRQRAITAKLKELRSVRVLIAKHGRMEEVECVRMVERLKQVEDLFFRQLIASSKELADRLKDDKRENTLAVNETEGCAVISSSTKAKLKKDNNQTIPSGSKASKTADNKGKRSDETVDKLFNTAHLLRNCISAMSKKKHAKRGKRAENDSTGKIDIEIHRQHGKMSAQAERKSEKLDVKKQNSEASQSQNTHIHNASSTSTVSTEQESDMSIGSPQADQYHLQQPKGNTDDSTDKIVLRLQRVRNSDDASSASTEDARSAESPHHYNDAVEKDRSPRLQKVPLINEVIKAVGNGHGRSNQSDEAAKFYTEDECSNKTCASDGSSSGSTSEWKSSRLNKTLASNKDESCAVFTGPTKEQMREEEKRERKMVKEAWNRVFPSASSSQTRVPCRRREDSNSRDSEPQKPKDANKRVKHVYGNPVIRGNLTSIGNINVTRQVGGSSESKFQWLLKQLQKKRNGESQWKQKNQLRMSPSLETNCEDGREYVSLISRGVQTRNCRMKDQGNVSTSGPFKMTEQEEMSDNKENDVNVDSLLQEHSSSVGSNNGNTKKRCRVSTGSGGKPQEKLPRIRSPTSDYEGIESAGFIDQNDDLQDLISLREEVLSRQSSSSEDTVEYSDNLISVEENVRRLKSTEKEKKKLRSTGTMTEELTKNKSSVKQSNSVVGRKFATKTGGHGKYGWCKKKITSKMSKSKRTKKRTNSSTSKSKTKAKGTSTQKNVVILLSDDSLEEQSEEESPEKEKVTQKGRRNTLASLSARLWDECYWSTINDNSNPVVAVGTAKSILPSNNSPPTTRRTGLESKMLGLWTDLLRYSGNDVDVDSLPVTIEDLDKMSLPLPLANSMKILLEGYNMMKQGSSFQPDQDSKSSTNAILNENNSAEIHVIQLHESVETPWEEQNRPTGETEDMADTSTSDDQESRVSSSSWEASRSTEFTLDTLTSHSVDTVGSGPTYHSSATASPPSLSTEDGYVPVVFPDTNLRRWQTSMQLASGTGGNGSVSPDYFADVMNRNETREEGDSGRSGSERADGVALGTSGWQISGAGDLREQRLVTAPNGTARNRRRQNRVMSWPNILPEEEDSEDDIPLAKLIEKERLKKIKRDIVTDNQPLKAHSKIDVTDLLDEELIPSSPDSDLPGPFLLGRLGVSDISTNSPILENIADENQHEDTESMQNTDTMGKESDLTVNAATHPQIKQTDMNNHPERLEENGPIDHSPAPLKKSGKFLYGHSKKGKALVRKRNRAPDEMDQLSSRSNDTGPGRRFVVSCSPPVVGTGNHLFYKSDSSPDIFD